MGTILCATRGGEASIHTQEHAIRLAKERSDTLIFLYVADVKFLYQSSASVLVDVETEIEHMGEFLLLMAKERAENEGVAAEILIKRGAFGEALLETAQEVQASLIILGSPDKNNLTQMSVLESVAAQIKEKIGIETIIRKAEL